MDSFGALETLAEVSVTLSGFSGLVVAFRSGAASSLDTWLPRERLIFWLLLVSSLSALFFSLLPLVLGAFLLSDAAIWRGSSLALFPFLFGAVGAAWRVNRRLARTGHPSVIPGVWALGGPVTVLVAGIQLANVFGVFGARAFGVYLLGPLLMLGMACLMFVAFLIYPTRRRE